MPSTLRKSPAVSSAKSFPLRAFFGHHKCATGFIDGILREICWHMGLNFSILHQPANYVDEGSIPAFVDEHQVDVLAYTNADAREISDLSFHRGFHVVRDPRDVLVSAYFSHRNSHPTASWPALAAHREALRACPKEEGLFLEMEFSRPFFEDMYRWDYNQPHVLELHMETLTQNPTYWFVEIMRFLDMAASEEPSGIQGLMRKTSMRLNRLNQKGRRFMPANLPMFPVPRHRMHTIAETDITALVEKRSFEKLAGGRKKGQENVKSHYRKGVPGDWKSHLSPDHISRFKQEYNDLLVRLGYETSSTWA
jgi:hypothetical protein